jgi:TatD DNase family protein
VPHQGERSEPAFLRHVLAALALARGEPVEETQRITSANARRIFRSW